MSQIVSWTTSTKHWDLGELTSNACLSTTFCEIFIIEKNIAILYFLIIQKSRQLVYCPYHERCFLFPFLIRRTSVVSAVQNTVTEVLETEDAPGVALDGTRISALTFMWDTSPGSTFPVFLGNWSARHWALSPALALVGGCSSAGVASPPKSISVTPLDRCHRVPAVISPFA